MKTKTLLSILMIALCSQLSHSQFLKKNKEKNRARSDCKKAKVDGEDFSKDNVMLSAINDDTDFYNYRSRRNGNGFKIR
jgi:hypothetical protein